MKLALVSLLLPIFAAASASLSSSYEAECFDDEYEYVNLPILPEVEVWDYVNPESKIPGTEMREIGSGPLNWSLMSYFGSFFNLVASPLKQSSSSPTLEAASVSESDADLETMSLIMNCEKERLRSYDTSIRKRVASLKDVSTKIEILSNLAKIGVRSLFELFFESNLAIILSEIACNKDFVSVAFNCIIIDSINSLVNIMLNVKYRLNGPHAVIVASINGSHEVLQYILEQQLSPDFAWEWKSFDGGDGFVFDFGSDSISAALFVGSLKAMSGNHLNCLEILVSKGANVNFKDYTLLKFSTSVQGSDAFKILFTAASNISASLMDEILGLAISNNNESLATYLLSLDHAYSINIENHLSSAVISNNINLFKVINARFDPNHLNSQVISLAASTGNLEIFIELLSVSSADLVTSAICSCITNETLQYLVAPIVEKIPLSSEIVAQALLHAVKARSLPLVHLFLAHEQCDHTNVCPSFIEALITDDIEIFYAFFGKFSADKLIRPKLLSKTVSKLFEIQAWNSMKFFVENYFNFEAFPKFKFVSAIILTDKVEIARIAADKGAVFLQSELVKIRDDDMREFVMKKLGSDKTKKAQTKNRNKN